MSPNRPEQTSDQMPEAQAVLQSVKVPAEVAAGPVDGFTDRAVGAVPVNDVLTVQGEHLACRSIGLPLAPVLPGPQRHRQPRESVLGCKLVPQVVVPASLLLCLVLFGDSPGGVLPAWGDAVARLAIGLLGHMWVVRSSGGRPRDTRTAGTGFFRRG